MHYIYLLCLLPLIYISSSSQVSACSIPTPTPVPNNVTPLPPHTLENIVHDSDIIFIGTVIDAQENRNGMIDIAEVAVERYLKGQGLNTINVYGIYRLPCSFVSIGTGYIFFISEDTHNTLSIYRSSEENIGRIVAVTGQSSPPEMTISEAEAIAQTDDLPLFAIVSTLAAIIFIPIILFIGTRQTKRKRKTKR